MTCCRAERAAERILEGLEQDRFLILTHPEMHDFVVGKARGPAALDPRHDQAVGPRAGAPRRLVSALGGDPAPRAAGEDWSGQGTGELSGAVSIREVGPRDGFQNEPEMIPTERKVELIDALARTGVQTARGDELRARRA